jgi:hypothetical protein
MSANERPGMNPTLVAGSEDGHLIVWDSSGQVLWSVQPSFQEIGYFLWRLCTPSVVRTWVGDIDGDGHTETLGAFGDNDLCASMVSAGNDGATTPSLPSASSSFIRTWTDDQRSSADKTLSSPGST